MARKEVEGLFKAQAVNAVDGKTLSMVGVLI
jgi:hypothetical protein